jgi:hypothetical protein
MVVGGEAANRMRQFRKQIGVAELGLINPGCE